MGVDQKPVKLLVSRFHMLICKNGAKLVINKVGNDQYKLDAHAVGCFLGSIYIK